MKAARPPASVAPPGRLAQWLSGVAALLFGAVALAYGYYVIFSQKLGDDEGYLMISLQGFMEGHPLYDSVFTQYGPFYYFYQWLVRSVTSLPLTHDATRLFCIFHWLTASVVLGLAGGILMRSAIGGIFVFMQAVVHLTSIANEPGHPQELVAGLLALSVLAATGAARRIGDLEILAVIGAALAFTKVNVGAFFCFALLLAMRCRATDRWSRGPWIWLLGGICAALPFWLMRFHLAAPWCRNYSIMAAATIVAALGAACRCSSESGLEIKRYFKVAAYFLIPSAIMLGVAVLKGSSVQGLIEGLIATPLKMPKVSLLPTPAPNSVLLNAAAALAMAALVGSKACSSQMLEAVTAAKGLYGVAGSLSFVADINLQLNFLLPWIWLVLIPVGKARGDAGESLPRLFLGLAAAWQGLQAYPIAGTQMALATFLLVVVCSVCLADALKAVGATDRVRQRLTLLTQRQIRLVQSMAVVGLLFLFANVWCQPQKLRDHYSSLTPLDLPGSRRIRLEPEATQLYRNVTKYLVSECDTFITYPGVNSFYFWTGKRPPTQLNSTGWGWLSHRQQEQILDALKKAKRPMIVVHESPARGWAQYVPVEILPLVRCVREEFQEVNRIGPYLFYEPKNRTE